MEYDDTQTATKSQLNVKERGAGKENWRQSLVPDKYVSWGCFCCGFVVIDWASRNLF